MGKGKYLISRKNIKDITGLRVSQIALEEIDLKIRKIIKNMGIRAYSNGRVTILSRDSI